jgi:hypothetical protein
MSRHKHSASRKILSRFLISGGFYTSTRINDENYGSAHFEGLVKYNPKKKLLSYRDHNAENDEIINQFKDKGLIIFALSGY